MKFRVHKSCLLGKNIPFEKSTNIQSLMQGKINLENKVVYVISKRRVNVGSI